MAATASASWRVATGNAMLLALYLVPAWAYAVWKIWVAPIHGLFATANLGPAMFAANFLHLEPLNLVRFALLVALAKFTVVVFFIAFAVFSLSSREDEREEGRELLHVGLALAAIVAFVSTILAWRFGEAEALRLHATETLMILSAAIVVIADVPQAELVQDNVPLEAAMPDPVPVDVANMNNTRNVA
jgi:hypothetical protein